jgi:hypothetical protein
VFVHGTGSSDVAILGVSIAAGDYFGYMEGVNPLFKITTPLTF